MANKSILVWIVRAFLLLVVIAVVWSLWSSLRDTRAKLEAQRKKMQEIEQRDRNLTQYLDSLNSVIRILGQREDSLTRERDRLWAELQRINRRYADILSRVDTLWEVGAINTALDAAFPHWAGQFRDARRADGVHAILVPQMFGPEVIEIKTELDQSQEVLENKNREIANLEQMLSTREQRVAAVTQQRDSLQTTYDNLLGEYRELDRKYRKEVLSHWFKISVGNVVSAGVGFGAGYLIGRR